MSGWIDDAKADTNDIGDLAETLGLERKRKTVECPQCGGRHSDGKLTGYIGRNNLIHCRRGCKTLDVVGLVAVQRMMAPGSPEDWRELQAECAALGLCAPPRDIADDAIRRLQRRAKSAKWQMQAKRALREAEAKRIRAAQLPDVAGQIKQARAQTQASTIEAFARDVRRMPDAIAQGIASVAFEGIVDATDLPCSWARRWRRKVQGARVLAFPVYGADGVTRSAALRRSDGLAFKLRGGRRVKSLNLYNADTGGGMDNWPGIAQDEGEPLRCRSFGAVPAGVDRAIVDGCALWLAEGEIDAMALRGFLAAEDLPGVVIGADGVGQLPNIARVAAYYAKGRTLQVVMVSDRDSDPMKQAPAARALTSIRAIFPSALHLDITDVADDLADVLDVDKALARGTNGVAELRARVAHLQRFPDARMWTIPHTADATARRLPDLDLAELRGRVTAIRASMGTGKTYQAERLTEQMVNAGGTVVAVAPTQALARGMAQRLGLPLYSDTTGRIRDSAVFCINSLGRFDGAPSLLIIDEFEQVNAAITQGTVPHFEGDKSARGTGRDLDPSIDVHQCLYEMVRHAAGAGGAVMVCDATLSDASVALLNTWAPGRVDVIEHLVEAVGCVVMAPTQDDALAIAMQGAASGLRIGFMTDRKGNVEGIAHALEAAYPEDHSVRTYTGTSLEGRKADLRDPRSAWGKGQPGAPSAVVCSPVVGSGVDAEAVDLVVCEFHGTIDAAACMQMMGRFRGSTRFVVYASEGAPRGARAADYATVQAEFEGRAQSAEQATSRFLEARRRRAPSRWCRNEPDALHMESCMSVEIVRAGDDGEPGNDCVLDIPKWDFAWQELFVLAEPVTIQPGDRVRLNCDFDNSMANQPVVNGEQLTPRDVEWGEGTLDEMCYASLTRAQRWTPALSGQTQCAGVGACRAECDDPESLTCIAQCIGEDRSCGQCMIGALAQCGVPACLTALTDARSCITDCLMFGGDPDACMAQACPVIYADLDACLTTAVGEDGCPGIAACE